jgi:hypothetical protein
MPVKSEISLPQSVQNTKYICPPGSYLGFSAGLVFEITFPFAQPTKVV